MDVVVVHRLLVFGLLSFISLTSATGVATESPGTWSNWINAGSPAGTGVDDESLDKLSRVSQLPCDPSAVVQVECRKVGSGVAFSEQRIFVNNVLQLPCNTSGLVCRDDDQPQGVRCSDYEIRVLCSGVTGKPSGDSSGSSGGGIGSNGGFIAMAAGGSVVIPLVCVLVVQLRKSKRDERRRALQAARAASQSAQVEQAACGRDAPPTYDELFGSSETRLSTTSTITNTSTRSADSGIDVGSADMLIVNELRTASRPSVTSYYSVMSAESSSSSSLPPVTAGMSSAPTMIVTTPSLEAVEEASMGVTDMSLQASEASPAVTIDSASNVGVSARRESFASDLSETASHSSGDALLASSSASTTLVHSDHLSDTASHSSTDGLLTSSSNLVHNDPPPPYDFHNPSREEMTMGERCRSCSSSTGSSSDDDNNSSCNVSVSSMQPQRRFLGMHLSIHDLLAVIYQEGERASTPPPTYDDALKIIGVQGQPKVPTTQ